MRRREFLGVLGGAAAWPLAARAQEGAARPLIGLLSPLSAITAARNIEVFRATLRDLGYVEDRNITIALRFADGVMARMSDLASELVALRPAVIVAGSTPAAVAVSKATRTIPVVAGVDQDPMALGLAISMARPGGNVTGIWTEGDQALIGKRMQVLKDAVPSITRVGAIANPDDAADMFAINSLPSVAGALGLAIRTLEVRTAAEIEPAFAVAVREGLQGLHVSQSPLFTTHRAELVALAARIRLPTVYGFREFVTAGGMMSYATNLLELYRQHARFVAKILKGDRPADLPIERPTKFELVVNLKTAKALGISIPETFLLNADEVIE